MGGNLSLHHRVQIGYGAHPASYPRVIRVFLSWGVKRQGHEADRSPPSSAKVKECVELYLQSPDTPSWRGAQLKEAQGQLYDKTPQFGAFASACEYTGYFETAVTIVSDIVTRRFVRPDCLYKSKITV